jgi:16S rRNA (guanine(527)-N(7))-methyltransferase RsmG
VEQSDELTLLADYAARNQIFLSGHQINSFRTYLDQLQAWSQLTNLTTIIVTEDIVIKHFIDSIAVLQLEHMRVGATLLDVGSGAGFPGIPLKIARPDLSLTLIEPSPKKASFLHFIVGCLKLEDTKVYSEIFERFVAHTSPNSFEYITTRALRHDLVLKPCARILDKGGKVLLYTSKPLNESDVGSQWTIEKMRGFELPRAKGARVISALKAV